MYAQFQSYQQGGTAVAAPSQQWNGSSFVPTVGGAANVNSGTFSTYNSSTQNFASSSVPVSTTPTSGGANTNNVTTYTQYYNQWNAKSVEQKSLASRLPENSTEKAEALRQAQWADYYADQSSRCAHYYAGNTGAVGTEPPQSPPAPPPLLSASGAGGVGGVAGGVATQQQPQQQQQQQPSSWASVVAGAPRPAVAATTVATATPHATPAQPLQQPSSVPPPGGGAVASNEMKNYVHRCLAKCTTDEQKQWVQKQVEKTIANAITHGNLHTLNWKTLELITYPTNNSHKRPHHHQESPQNTAKKSRFAVNFPNASPSAASSSVNNNSYYGHISSNTTGGSSNVANNNSYYGPSSSNNNTGGGSYYGPSSSSSTSNHHQQQQRPPSPNNSYSSGRSNNDRNNSNKNSRYEDKLPVNNSYYGRSSSTVSSTSSSKKDNMSDLGDIDFISIPSSTSSSKKSNKKKNKSKSGQGFGQSSETLSKRAERFSGEGGISSSQQSSSKHTTNSHDRYMGKSVIGGGTNGKKLDDTDYERMTVKGTCTKLEKNYLRLTSPPKATLVRPKSILQQHLSNLKAEYKLPKSERKHDYLWFCSQFKAVRQDLTVQRINDEFAVDTYETHARIALQEGDLNEYNQCQTQLKELYDSINVSNTSTTVLPNQFEFIAYRLIYYVFLTGNSKYEGGSSDLFKIMLSLTPEQRNDPCIAHALKVRVAVAEFDYHAFFRLQDEAPKLGAYLMDFMVPNVRHWALQRICKAYRPSVPVNFVLRELGFGDDDPNSDDDDDSTAEGREWLTSCGCVLSDDGKILQAKDSVVHESDMNKKNSLI